MVIDNGKQNNRKLWHTECVRIWKICNDPKVARLNAYQRDSGKCAGCHETFPLNQLELDHIRPLFEADGDLEFWMEGNHQLLCSPCHKEKTKDDVQRYHAGKRENQSE